MNTHKVLIWLNKFKCTWLPQHFSNNTHLIESISTKLHELEQLLIQDNQNEILIETEHQSANSCDTEPIILSTEQRPLSTPLDILLPINDENKKFSRPSIRLKRISLAEAERYLPSAWKTVKSKGARKISRKTSSINYTTRKKNKKNIQTNKILLSSTIQDETTNKSNGTRKSTRSKKSIQPPSINSITNTPPINSDKKKSKRKLRAIGAEDDDLYILGNLSQTENPNGNIDCDQISRYIGQNGILSQTRKTNETTYDDDFTIKLHSRQSKFSNHLNDTNLNTTTIESPLTEVVTIDEDVGTTDEEQVFQDVMENNDNESLFTSLDITNDKALETSPLLNNNSVLDYNDCIEDITNDGIDPPPSSSSPTFDHLSVTT